MAIEKLLFMLSDYRNIGYRTSEIEKIGLSDIRSRPQSIGLSAMQTYKLRKNKALWLFNNKKKIGLKCALNIHSITLIITLYSCMGIDTVCIRVCVYAFVCIYAQCTYVYCGSECTKS
jgi:hypothetical protein